MIRIKYLDQKRRKGERIGGYDFMILTLKIVSCEIGEKFWGIVTIATGRITKFLNVKLEKAKTVTDFIDSRNNN